MLVGNWRYVTGLSLPGWHWHALATERTAGSSKSVFTSLTHKEQERNDYPLDGLSEEQQAEAKYQAVER